MRLRSNLSQADVRGKPGAREAPLPNRKLNFPISNLETIHEQTKIIFFIYLHMKITSITLFLKRFSNDLSQIPSSQHLSLKLSFKYFDDQLSVFLMCKFAVKLFQLNTLRFRAQKHHHWLWPVLLATLLFEHTLSTACSLVL